jgi:hypothetical protein
MKIQKTLNYCRNGKLGGLVSLNVMELCEIFTFSVVPSIINAKSCFIEFNKRFFFVLFFITKSKKVFFCKMILSGHETKSSIKTLFLGRNLSQVEKYFTNFFSPSKKLIFIFRSLYYKTFYRNICYCTLVS